MQKHKFYNETFDFNFTLVVFNGDKTKDIKAVNKLMDKLGYDKSVIIDCIDNCNAVAMGDIFNGFILFNTHKLSKFKKKEKTIERLKVLAHECNHVKEHILADISEKDGNKETECAMRISDWCFTKCLSTPFFKKLLK